MKKQLFCTIFFVLLISVCFGQKPYKVVFYNLENFFDTINDPEVKDDEFTPEGPKKWNTAKYNKKLGNIDWTRPAVEIERLIRGLNPWPSAYTSWSDKTMKIWEAEVLDKESGQAPGTVAEVDKKTFAVQTGKGMLKILSLQLPGKKRMDTDAFLRGNQIKIGEIL